MAQGVVASEPDHRIFSASLDNSLRLWVRLAASDCLLTCPIPASVHLPLTTAFDCVLSARGLTGPMRLTCCPCARPAGPVRHVVRAHHARERKRDQRDDVLRGMEHPRHGCESRGSMHLRGVDCSPSSPGVSPVRFATRFAQQQHVTWQGSAGCHQSEVAAALYLCLQAMTAGTSGCGTWTRGRRRR